MLSAGRWVLEQVRQRLILPKGALVGDAGQGDPQLRLLDQNQHKVLPTSPAALKSRGLKHQVAD